MRQIAWKAGLMAGDVSLQGIYCFPGHTHTHAQIEMQCMYSGNSYDHRDYREWEVTFATGMINTAR